LPLATAPVGIFFFFYPKDARQDSPGGAKNNSKKSEIKWRTLAKILRYLIIKVKIDIS